MATSLGVFEVVETMEIHDIIERQTNYIGRMLGKRYRKLKPAQREHSNRSLKRPPGKTKSEKNA